MRVARLGAAGLLILLAAYSNFFRNDFHFDDAHVIVENAAIRSLEHWPRFFTDAHTFSSLPQNATYRPLVTLTYALDYAIGGELDPVPFHITQLVLLIAVALLLGAIAMKLFGSGWMAVAAATLFAVHTANTETMNFLSSRSELLSAIGFLLALYLFASHATARRYHLYLIPLLIGALAKAPVVIFAAVVVAWVRIVEQRSWRDAVKDALPSLIAGVIALVLLNRMNAPEWTSGGGSAYHYAITQPFVWLHYARLAILPVGLTADTDMKPFAHWYETEAIAGYVFVALLVLAIVKLKDAPVRFGLAFFAITLLPTSLFPLAEVANEHRLFFPLMGFAIAAVSALWRYRFVVPVAIVLLAIGTHERNKVWATEETLWKDVTEKSPNNGRAWMNYGLTQMEQGRLAEAKALFERAALLNPNYSTLEINRGVVHAALGDAITAERHFRRALELSTDRSSHFYYARFLVQRGRIDEARPHLETAARMAPSWTEPRRLLETLSRECASYDECYLRGLAATNANRHAEAIALYRRAIVFREHPDAWNNLGWSLQQLGRIEEARRAYEQTLKLDPAYERAINNLATMAPGP